MEDELYKARTPPPRPLLPLLPIKEEEPESIDEVESCIEEEFIPTGVKGKSKVLLLL